MTTREIHSCVDSMWIEAVKSVLLGSEQQSREGKTREIQGYASALVDIRHNFLSNAERNLSISYAAAEFMYYMAASDTTSFLTAYAPSFESYVGGPVDQGAYGVRWARQLPTLVELLKHKRETRQAVLQTWSLFDLFRARESDDGKNVPCTLTLHFIERDGALHLHACMRSSDLWLGFPYDVFCFTTLQMMLADHLSLGYGTYYHYSSSLHLYEKHVERARRALPSASAALIDLIPVDKPEPSRFFIDQSRAVQGERLLRTKQWAHYRELFLVEAMRVSPKWRALLWYCASKLLPRSDWPDAMVKELLASEARDRLNES